MVVAFVLVALLAAPPALLPVAAQEPQGAATNPVRFLVGLHHIDRDVVAGDTWHGGEILRVDRRIDMLEVESSDPGFFAAASDDPDVRWVEHDVLRYTLLAPNDPRWGEQYGPQHVRADAVWDLSFGDTTKNVCIIDTGMRYTHEDITGARYLGGYDFGSNDADPWDIHGHGTHVGGIAAATTNNAKGVAGVGQVGIKNVKVMNGAGQIWNSDVIEGIEWCADNDGHVINLSLGGPSYSSAEKAAVDYAWNKGMIVVAAAGNDGPCSDCVLYPAAHANSIAVSCTTSSQVQCSFSSDGPEIDLAAPGYDILATCYSSNTNYCKKSGTSMSSPHVAGAAALVWSLAPHLTNADVRQLLEDNAKDLGAAGWDQLYGHGLVDAKASFDAAEVIHPQTPLLTYAFDAGTAPGWTLTGLWHVDDNCATAPSSPNYLGWHRTSVCDYNDLVSTTGTARFNADLTGQLQATLVFDHRWETESNSEPYDIMQVQVSTNSGSSWTTLEEWDSRDPNQLSWKEKEIYLNTYVGQNIQIRFRFDARDTAGNAYDGWLIDNVVVLATDNFPPIADAGPDRSAVDADGSGAQAVTLDGRNSRDQNTGGSIVSYEWYLGTTLVATGANPTASFAVGTHTVRLVVTDDDGATDDDTMKVTVAANTPPIARAGSDRTAGDPDGSGDAPVALDGSTSSDSDGTITTYEWRRGGALVGTGATPTVTVPVGAHDIELKVIDNGGASHTDLVRVTVNPNVAPIAVPGPDITTSDGDADGTQTVHLDGSGSTDSDGTITAYHWREGATTLATTAAADVALGVGVHTVTLEVTDNGGTMSSAAITVTIGPNHAPVADPGPDREVSDPDESGDQSVTLDGSASHDDDGTIVSYLWEQGGSTIATTAATTLTLPLGDHTFSLTVTDNGGATHTDIVVISVVANLSPVPSFTVDCGGLTCDLDASASTDDGAIVQHDWTFGDGDSASLTAATTSHTYAAEGTYTVCLTVTDDIGQTGHTCQDIDVRALLFFADFDDGTTGGISVSGLWRVTSLCTTPPSAPNYLGYHNAAACTFSTGTSNSGNAEFTADLSAVTDPVLSFRHRWQTYHCCSAIHRMYVQVQPGATGSWTTLSYWDARDPNQLSWQEKQVSLSSYAGTTVGLRFRFEAGTTSNNYAGWHIDWVQVGAAGALTAPPVPPVAVAGPDLTRADADNTGAEVVRLDGSGSSDADGTIVAYEWKKGTTVLGTTAVLDHSFTVGTHNLVLTVTDDDGETATDALVVTVTPNAAPTARAGADRTLGDADGDGTATVALDGSTSTDPDGTLVKYEWTEGGAPVATGATPTVPLTVGTHSLQLRVTDNGGATSTDTVFIEVTPNAAPTARAGLDRTLRDIDGTGAETTTLDATASTDPDGPLAQYVWSRTGAEDLLGPTHTLDLAVGTYTFTLRVTDPGGLSATDDVVVTVLANEAPIAAAGPDVRKNDDDRNGGEPFFLDGRGSSDPDGAIVTWAWHDGPTLLAETATANVFLAVGVHHITLTVTDQAGATDVDDLIINVTNNRPPVPAFSFTCTTVQCDFNAGASSDPDGDPLTYTWDFGDGRTGSGKLVTHAFPHAGFFTTCLTVRDHEKSASLCKQVHLFATTYWEDFETGSDGWSLSGLWRVDSLCRAGPEGPRSLGYHSSLICMYQTTGQTMGSAIMTVDLSEATSAELRFQHRWVTETTTGSTARDLMAVRASSNGGTSYHTLADWDSRDPNQPDWKKITFDLTPRTGNVVKIKFDFDSFNALFNHYDGWQIDQVEIWSDQPAPNRAPTASFTTDCEDPVCSFDGSASSDIGGVIVDWDWDFGDGTTGSGRVVEHMYTQSGTFTVTLTVTDNGGLTATTTRTVTVAGNNVPTASFTSDCTGLTCRFDAAGSSDPDGDVVDWDWDFGDGEIGAGELIDHTFAAEGSYTVRLVVTDDLGATDDVEDVVSVAPVGNTPPTASFTWDCTGLACSFDAAASHDPDGDLVAWAWDFGDGAEDSGVLVDHTFAAGGTYTVALTVTDDEGATDLDRRDVEVDVQVEEPITGPPTAPPPDPHAPDTVTDVIDLTPTSWMDIQSAWLDDDADALYVGLKVRDIPALASTTSRNVAYHVEFEPGWTMADPTFGGRVPAVNDVLRFEVRAIFSPPQTGMQFHLYVETLDPAGTERRTDLGPVAGWFSVTTDIVWWRVPFGLIQGDNGDEAHDPQGFATPAFVSGSMNWYGTPWDRTGAGRSHTL